MKKIVKHTMLVSQQDKGGRDKNCYREMPNSATCQMSETKLPAYIISKVIHQAIIQLISGALRQRIFREVRSKNRTDHWAITEHRFIFTKNSDCFFK